MLARVRAEMKARQLRVELLGEIVSQETAWSMMLHLFAAELERKHVSVSVLCAVSGAPRTTALRTIMRLGEAGLVGRQADLNDRRRAFMRLTPVARELLARYVAERPGACSVGRASPI